MNNKKSITKIIVAVILISLALNWKAFKHGVVDGWNDAMAATK